MKIEVERKEALPVTVHMQIETAHELDCLSRVFGIIAANEEVVMDFINQLMVKLGCVILKKDKK